MTFSEAVAGAAAFNLAGHDDWRLPTIKELYSLIIFSGIDPSGYEGTATEGLVPFINTDYFDFAYGDTDAGERIIDAQFATSSMYVDGQLLFGVNFADGRIKGYGLQMPFGPGEKTFFVFYVRGNATYGINNFSNNGDGTISDNATGLMWMQNDSQSGMNWEDALSFAENLDFAGYSDWRLPNVKELQSIVDYTCSPGTTNSAAIDPLFNSTQITNEAGEADYPSYWSGTTHAKWSIVSGGFASYVSFGRAMDYIGNWQDVHGAGAQRSDLKIGDPSEFSLEQNFPNPFNPTTQILVSIPESGNYTLKVYNILGQEVATLLNDQVSAGNYNFYFDASSLTSGIYIYSLTGNNFTQTKKMTLLK
ncbi:MAG: DUF1566 domain-containing protein [Ignavibacteriae bacterium]|nr:DUF1566 domain-containing protein [Ignavibacteriota bacterium]NOG98964.1 DUF1566 domain-containing protein [Ignavibacteriota bacterium]